MFIVVHFLEVVWCTNCIGPWNFLLMQSIQDHVQIVYSLAYNVTKHKRNSYRLQIPPLSTADNPLIHYEGSALN